VSWTDRAPRVATGLTVVALAGVAGSMSFSHMASLAARHGQTGWHASAFPVSVDGLELVASLFLVSQRRAGRHIGWLPWAALLAGTAASLAANIAVGGDDLVGRALAGWPAVSLLVSMKLFFAMFDHHEKDRQPVPDGERTAGTRPAVPGTVPGTDRADVPLSRTVPAQRADGSAWSGTVPDSLVAVPALASEPDPADRTVPVDLGAVAGLVPAARATRDALAAAGRPLSRGRLAERMRADGHAVSNARASLLVKALRAEATSPPATPASRFAGRDEATDQAA